MNGDNRQLQNQLDEFHQLGLIHEWSPLLGVIQKKAQSQLPTGLTTRYQAVI